MPASPRSLVPLLMAVTLVVAAVILWLRQASDSPPRGDPTPSRSGESAQPSLLRETTPLPPLLHDGPTAGETEFHPPLELPPLSVLAGPPDWEALEIYQRTITREHFERLLSGVFTTSDSWRQFIAIHDDRAEVRTHGVDEDDVFVLEFAPDAREAAAIPRAWRPGAALPPAPPDKPLDGIHLAIDPGHIGGKWAKMEERWFSLNDDPPVTEGDMTLKVAMLLKPALEKLGARVTLVRDKPEPITSMRPEMLMDIAADGTGDSPAAMQRLAERLFYRTAEIRARAYVVNQSIKPDLVLCLHFNAEAWGDPAKPTLVDGSHFHVLLNGGYTDHEISLADQRFTMLKKLLQRTHEEEALVGATVADVFAQMSGLPPYRYPANAPNARQVGDHPFLWARNLLANRLYDCPVIFMEPYIMNSRQDYARIQAGDYPGMREIHGEKMPSIYREYVDALIEGLAKHYRVVREITAQ